MTAGEVNQPRADPWPPLLTASPGAVHGIFSHPFTGRLPAEMPSGECRDTPGDTRRPLADRSAALRIVSGHLTGASLRALRQDPAEVAVLRPELDAPGVIGAGPAALRAGAGQLLIPSDPTIAAVGKVSHITEANPGPVLPRGRTRSRCLPTASGLREAGAGQRCCGAMARCGSIRGCGRLEPAAHRGDVLHCGANRPTASGSPCLASPAIAWSASPDLIPV